MKPFEGLLGNNCELRMLEYLLPFDGMDFNITELTEEVGVSKITATESQQNLLNGEYLIQRHTILSIINRYNITFALLLSPTRHGFRLN